MFCPSQLSNGRVAAVLSELLNVYVKFLYVCGYISQLEDSAKNNAYIKKEFIVDFQVFIRCLFKILWELSRDLGALIFPIFLSNFNWNTLSMQLSVVFSLVAEVNTRQKRVLLVSAGL